MQAQDMLTLALTRAITDSLPAPQRASGTRALYDQLLQSADNAPAHLAFERALAELRQLYSLLVVVATPEVTPVKPPTPAPPKKKEKRAAVATKRPRQQAAAPPAATPPARASRRDDDDAPPSSGAADSSPAT